MDIFLQVIVTGIATGGVYGLIALGFAVVPSGLLWGFIFAAVGTLVFILIFKLTRTGVAMRATASDQQAALSMGISVRWIFALSWSYGAVAAVIGGIVIGNISGISIYLGDIGLKVLAVIILGGLMASPTLMLMDEPSMGLSPMLVGEIFEIIRRINTEQGVSIVLVEQNARLALDIADHAYVMENGRIVLDDTVDKIKDNADVKEFYLGLTEVGKKKSYRDVKHYKRRKRWLT